MKNAWEAVAILRTCLRCRETLPLSKYRGIGKLCQGCVAYYKPTDYTCRMRAIVITASGRELLKQIHAEEAAASSAA